MTSESIPEATGKDTATGPCLRCASDTDVLRVNGCNLCKACTDKGVRPRYDLHLRGNLQVTRRQLVVDERSKLQGRTRDAAVRARVAKRAKAQSGA